jgi:type II secretory pathway pseudopilin PulG
MRKAFTLVELLVVIGILPFVMFALSGVFMVFIRDIPRATRVLQENTTVLNMLRQTRRDMDRAIGLPGQFNGWHADEHTLLIKLPDSVVCYQFEDGKVLRTVSREESRTAPGEGRLWRIPNAVVTWRLWTQDGGAYAAEIHSHVRRRVGAQLKNELASSQVFFVHALGKGDELR